jgi:hypothetical protein
MKRIIGWKKIIRMILNTIMLLSLTGCVGCEEFPPYTLHIHNLSSMTVKVAVEGAVGKGGGAFDNYLTLAPDDSGEFILDNEFNWVYLAKAQPVDDWLKFVEERRQRILRIIDFFEKQTVTESQPLPNDLEGGKSLQDLRTELNGITAEINSSQGKTKEKECRGFVYTGEGKDSTKSYDPYVVITDGESAHTIIIACLYKN